MMHIISNTIHSLFFLLMQCMFVLKLKEFLIMATTETSYNEVYKENISSFRHFLDFLSYGCYSRQIIKNELMAEKGTYDKKLAFLNTCISNKYWSKPEEYEYRKFYGDSYRLHNNYILPIFFMKPVGIKELFSYIILLQTIQELGPISLNSLQREISLQGLTEKQQEYFPTNESTLKRRLNDLIQYGFIKKVKRKYSIIRNVFDDLTQNELAELIGAVNIYCDAATLTLPGNYLKQTLYNLYRQKYGAIPPQLYQIKNNNLLRISSDPTLYALCYYITQKQPIRFEYYFPEDSKNKRKQIISGLPCRIITDTYNRQYVVLQKKKGSEPYLINRILSKIHPLASQNMRQPTHLKVHSLRAVQLRFHYQNPQEKQFLEAQLQNNRKKVSIKPETENTFLCFIKIQDPLKLAPWLRTLFPYVEVLSEGKLRKRIKESIEGALYNYGIL